MKNICEYNNFEKEDKKEDKNPKKKSKLKKFGEYVLDKLGVEKGRKFPVFTPPPIRDRAGNPIKSTQKIPR